jgi:hypothetical protein
MGTYDNAAVMSAISAILKEDWLTQSIIDQYGRDTPLLALLEKNKDMVEGEDAVLTMRLGPNVSTGARAEMATLPVPGKQLTKKVRIALAYWYTTCAFSGQAIKASKSDKGSLARVITDELENGIKDHKKVENFFFYGDGNGSLAQALSIDTLTVTVDRWCPMFQVGRKFDSYSARSSGTKRMDSQTITAVDRENLTVTFDAVTSLQANDYLYLEDTYQAVNMGLMGVCDDGTYVSTFQTLSRTTYPQLKARVFSGTGSTASERARLITEDLLLDVLARMREDGAKPDLFIGTSFQLRDLCSEAKEQRQFVDPKSKVSLGITGISIGDGVDFTFDSDCPAGYNFALTKEMVKIIEGDPLGFMDLDGNVLKWISRVDGYEAVLFHYYQLAAMSCYNQARIEDLIENRSGD